MFKHLLFNWFPCLNDLNMWKFSSVFKCDPFRSIFITFMISFILPNACPVSRMCCTYPDVSVIMYISYVFFVPRFKISACLAYVLSRTTYAF
jgi:hypothetical protein